MTVCGDFIIDCSEAPSVEMAEKEIFAAEFRSDEYSWGDTDTQAHDFSRVTGNMEVDLPSPESCPEVSILGHVISGPIEHIDSRQEFESDLLFIDLDPDVENAGKPHAGWFAFSPVRLPAFFTSALIHGSIFFLFAFFSASQVAGTPGYAGNVFSATIVSHEDLIPQNESPASIDSAASAASTAKKSKKVREIQQPPEQPVDVHDTGTEATRISMLEKRKPVEKHEEIKDPIKEMTDKKEDAQAEGLRNSVASLPSTASAERRFIPAAGQGGEAFESMVLSAIRASIFFPKQAAQERQHGEVVVAFAVNRDGSVSGLSIAKSSGFAILDEAAFKIIQKAAKKFPPFPDRLSMDALHYVVPILFKEKVK
jgi:protein TonB